jgi:flavin-dependent dehydrogenase
MESSPTPPPAENPFGAPQREAYDVVVIGGSLSGAATALLLRRFRPATRVLVVERNPQFDHKVGEATVEVSAFFLAHVLRLHRHLAERHLSKHGLRYYFSDQRGRSFAEMTEVGATAVPSLPSFQLDRQRLDEELLRLAAAEGAEVLRPARVADVELGWPRSTLELDIAGTRRRVEARWVLDASGRQTFLARRLGLLEKNADHPTAAHWGRWRKVRDLDGIELHGGDPRRHRLQPIAAARRLATSHFCDRGWWCWGIPLQGGETSFGLVHDKRLFELPPGESPRARYEAFLRSRDGLRELLAGAELDAGDYRSYDQLAYRSRRYADRGYALIGDAAAFIDPYYSPGLDHVSMTSYATARLVQEELDGQLPGAELERAVALHDERFQRSYARWFDGLYRDKYELFGDAELTATAFYLDSALYYLGVVHPVYTDVEELRIPLLGHEGWQARLAHRMLRLTNRRLITIARRRQARGTYGRLNVGWIDMVTNFGTGTLTLTAAHRHGLRRWLGVEWRELRERLGHRGSELAPQARRWSGERATPATAVSTAVSGASAPAPASAARR